VSAAPLDVGIVGAGWMGQLHAATTARHPHARVSAVASPGEAARLALAGRHPGAAAHPSLEALLASGPGDVVVICTPSAQHADQAVMAAQAGCHVVVEKPIATRPRDAARMIEAARAAGVTLSVIHQYRFLDDARRLRQAVADRRLGRLLSVHAELALHRDDEYFQHNGGWRSRIDGNGGGILINQAIHAVDLLRWIFGEPECVGAIGDTLASDGIEGEDTLTALLRFPDGVPGTLRTTQAAARDFPLVIDAIGTRGRATFARSRLTRWEVDGAEDAAAPAQADEPFGVAHERQLFGIFDALGAGGVPEVEAADAARSLGLVSSIYARAGFGYGD